MRTVLLQFPPSLLLLLLFLHLPSPSSGCSNDPRVSCASYSWACSSHPSWMALWCPQTCNTCQPCSCQDKPPFINSCPTWKVYCNHPWDWVRDLFTSRCPATCNTCQCCNERTNSAANCDNWAAAGFCSSGQYQAAMWLQCYKSCSSQECETSSGSSESSCKCGLAKRSTRIVGGQQAEVNEYPWQAGLVNRGGRNTFCGGSVIGDEWILTAGHCVDDKHANRIQVLLGEHNVMDNDFPVRTDISTITLHPNYVKDEEWVDTPLYYWNGNYYCGHWVGGKWVPLQWVNGRCGQNSLKRLVWDFALLKMRSKIDWTQNRNIRPICLPEASAGNYVYWMTKATGWGNTLVGGTASVAPSNVLREADLMVIPNHYCRGTWFPEMIESNVLCARDSHGLNGTCKGDSGGPLVSCGRDGNCGTTLGDNYEQIGVVSFGTPCGDRGRIPNAFGRVTAARAWIDDTVGGLNTCPRV